MLLCQPDWIGIYFFKICFVKILNHNLILKIMMPEKRNLSGIYCRFKNKKIGKWENRVFEDLPTEIQNETLKNKNKEWVIGLAIELARTLREVGDQFDIMKS